MKTQMKAYVSLALICIIWGTTYLAARIGVKDFPPFLFMGIRQTMAGLLLFFIVYLLKRDIRFGWKDVKLQLVPAICMVTFGNGIVAWAVQYIPSGLAALLCSMIPLYVVVINLMISKKEKLNWQIIAGTLTGLAGVLLIFKDQLKEISNKAYLMGILITMLSCIFWAIGTIYTQRMKARTEPLVNASLQLAIGGIGLFVMSFFAEDYHHIPALSANALGALIYLVLVGSVLAFGAYVYALSRLPVGLVTIYAYVNPLVAIILGFLILHEKVSVYTFIAFSITISGVYLVNAGYKKQKVV